MGELPDGRIGGEGTDCGHAFGLEVSSGTIPTNHRYTDIPRGSLVSLGRSVMLSAAWRGGYVPTRGGTPKRRGPLAVFPPALRVSSVAASEPECTVRDHDTERPLRNRSKLLAVFARGTTIRKDIR